MNIIDNERDVYDFWGDMYGKDMRLTYVRNKDISKKGGYIAVPQAYRELAYHFPHWIRDEDKPIEDRKQEYMMLTVLDKTFVMKVDATTTSGIKIAKGGSRQSIIQQASVSRMAWSRFRWGSNADVPTRIVDPDMYLAKMIGEPVFAFTAQHRNGTEIEIGNLQIPKLKYIGGVESLLDFQQVYQGIEMFIGEQKDRMEMPEASNDVKIVAAGFDKVVSFRHRK